MKKRILISSVALVMFIAIVLFIGTGFRKRADVYLYDYSVSENNTVITMNTCLASSMGYTRDYINKQDGDNQYIDFYCTFGGLNSSIGAKNKFEIEVSPNCDGIYF